MPLPKMTGSQRIRRPCSAANAVARPWNGPLRLGVTVSPSSATEISAIAAPLRRSYRIDLSRGSGLAPDAASAKRLSRYSWIAGRNPSAAASIAKQGGEPVSEGSDTAAVKVSLTAIFLAFLRLGCTSFGGGTAAWVYRDIVQRRGWIDEQNFLP